MFLLITQPADVNLMAAMNNAADTLSKFFAQSFRFFPTNLISRNWGRFTRSAASRHLIWPFAKSFAIDLAEAERDLPDYPTLNAFFTRALKSGRRPIDADPWALVYPVDGRVSEGGTCEHDQLLQIKGSHFDLFSLLRDYPEAKRFEDGSFVTLYLSPQDYHRIHAPLDLSIRSVGYMPGTLFPVNRPSVRFINGLYTQNERVILYADTQAGGVAIIMVGANCVGSIALSFHPFETNRPGQVPARLNFDKPMIVKKGEEVGMFQMGSTVILLFEKDQVRLDLPPLNQKIKMGRRMGSILEHSPTPSDPGRSTSGRYRGRTP